MISSNRIKYFLLFLTFNINIIANINGDANQTSLDEPSAYTQLTADQLLSELNISQQGLKELQEDLQDELETILKNVIEQYHNLEFILECLAQDIDNNCIKTVDKKAVIESIRTLRKIITEITSNAFSQLDPFTLQYLVDLSNALVQHINAALKNNLQDLGSFDPSTIQTRSFANQEFDLDTLNTSFEYNKESIKLLEKTASQVGLKWYNKGYRTLSNYFIDPALKYHVVQRGLKTGFAVAIPAYIARYFGYQPLIKIFGPMPVYSGITVNRGSIVGNDNQLKLLGRVEKFLYEHQQGMLPLLTLGLPVVWGLWKNELLNCKDQIIKYTSAAHNYLKGGIYRKQADRIREIIPTITFDDVQGDIGKDTLREIIKYIIDPERFDRAKCPPEKGYLLTGPTRTGKSYLAQALAGEIKIALKETNRDEDEFRFIQIPINLINSKGIEFILDLAKEEAPCVLFIDEIDLLQLQRAGGNPQILSEFLSSLSGTLDQDPKKQVIIIATTNQPENMDVALRQRGRFGVEIRFEYPGLKDRKEYMVKILNKLSLDVDNFDIDKLALETEGTSYEDIFAMFKGAFRRAKIKGIVVTQDQLDESLDKEIRKIIFSESKKLPREERHVMAVHQAGTAHAHILLETLTKVAKVTIKPVVARLKEELVWARYTNKPGMKKQQPIIYGQLFTYHETDTINLRTKEQLLTQCKLLLAGYAAERVILGSCGYSYRGKQKDAAYDFAKLIVFSGIDPKTLSKKTRDKMLDEAFELTRQCEEEMVELFTKHADTLKKISLELETKEILSIEEINKIIDPELDTATTFSITAEDIANELDLPEVPAIASKE